jgi:hypothetical protein
MVENLAEFAFHKQISTSIDVKPFTAPFNKRRSDVFEALILENRIHSYPHEILEEELRGLQKDKFGRVDHGPISHNDLYDCISTAAMFALDLPADAEDSYRGYAFGLDPSFAQVRM